MYSSTNPLMLVAILRPRMFCTIQSAIGPFSSLVGPFFMTNAVFCRYGYVTSLQVDKLVDNVIAGKPPMEEIWRGRVEWPTSAPVPQQ